MKNKGFSMVELIIVIAIMAILAGALAPALIKYINKSRISTDISNGQQIASAIQTSLSNESAYDDAVDQSTAADYATFYGAQGTDMQGELDKVLGTNHDSKMTTKAKKDIDGNAVTAQKFYVIMEAADNKLTVYAGGSTAGYEVYPIVGSKWSK